VHEILRKRKISREGRGSGGFYMLLLFTGSRKKGFDTNSVGSSYPLGKVSVDQLPIRKHNTCCRF
jgi:hypothetical protein